MGMSTIETPLLHDHDSESQGDGRISRVDEEYGALRGSSSAIASESHETSGCSSPSRKRTGLVVATSCIAVVLLLSTALVSYKMNAEGGAGKVENFGRWNPDNEFYTAERTSFHFQTEKNYESDPDAPMYYNGYYHFFYQYNPKGALWDIPVWGHTVSTDLIHWKYLEEMLFPDQWYDVGGAWSGSATILQDGTPVILYTGGHGRVGSWAEQTTNMIIPVDPSDPLLRQWKKVDMNPIMYNPDFVRPQDFRDPTTAWLEDDGLWRLAVGSRRDNPDGKKDGIALMYTSTDFVHWKLQEPLLRAVYATGMWECVDLYPVSLAGQGGLNHSVLRAEHYRNPYKYVMKVSLDDTRHDHYAVGTYSTETHTFVPDDVSMDVGIGLRYDYGKFYASKTFYDSSTGRRILWGYVNESDTARDDIIKGWACVQAIPRVIWLDGVADKYIVQWPVEEVEALRGAKSSLHNVDLQPSDVLKVKGGDGAQLDILVTFVKPDVSSVEKIHPDAIDFDCADHGSADRGVFGPFGVLVHADDNLTEQTSVFFYISPLQDGRWVTRVCSDQSRSSLAEGLDLTGYGSQFMVMPSENELSIRILVDHSIVESFVQGGRVAITARVYPTIAHGSKSRTYLFNNGSRPIQVKSMDVYHMSTVKLTTM